MGMLGTMPFNTYRLQIINPVNLGLLDDLKFLLKNVLSSHPSDILDIYC